MIDEIAKEQAFRRRRSHVKDLHTNFLVYRICSRVSQRYFGKSLISFDLAHAAAWHSNCVEIEGGTREIDPVRIILEEGRQK